MKDYQYHIFSPYRVCPLGAHVDHQHGLVTGFAIDKGVDLWFDVREDSKVILDSETFAGHVEFDIAMPSLVKQGDWGDYARGAKFALQKRFKLKAGIKGVLKGSADGTLYLTLIATDQTVSVGDNVVTSGLGGVYPKGLPLGKVLSVSKNDGDLYYTIVVEPVATFSNFEEVLVITSLTTGQEATADDISDADGQDSAQVSGASSDSEDSDSDAEDSDSSDGSGSDSDSGSSSDSDDSSDSSSKKNSKSSNSSSDSDSSDSDDSSSSSSSDSSKKEQNSTSSSSKKSNGSDDSDSTSSSGSSSD